MATSIKIGQVPNWKVEEVIVINMDAGCGRRLLPKENVPHLLYLGVSRPPDATLKRWQALQILSGLAIFEGV